MRLSPTAIPTPRFYVKQPTAGSRYRIFLVVRFNGRRVQVDTGHKFDNLKDWQTEKQRLRTRQSSGLNRESITDDRRAINDDLDAMQARVVARLIELRNAGQPYTEEAIRAAALPFRQPVIEDVDDYTLAKEEFLTDAATRLQQVTIDAYNLAFAKVEAVAGDVGSPLRLASFTTSFFDRYWQRERNIGGVTPDSFWSKAKNIKAFLNWCDLRGRSVPPDYRRFSRTSLPKENAGDKVYLSTDELRAIEQLPLVNEPSLAKARDIFLFLADTGLRFGDAMALTSANRTQDETGGVALRFVQQKTGKEIVMPLSSRALAIYERHNGKLPSLSNPKLNEYIKSLCLLAGIVIPLPVTEFTDGDRRTEMVPKWRLVTAHTGKASFITNNLLRGMSIEEVMKLTGNTRSSIETYVRHTREDAIRSFRKAHDRTMQPNPAELQ